MPTTSSTECGSDAGYQAHLRRGEDACEWCKEKHAEAMSRWHKQNPQSARTRQRIQRRAWQWVRDNHPEIAAQITEAAKQEERATT